MLPGSDAFETWVSYSDLFLLGQFENKRLVGKIHGEWLLRSVQKCYFRGFLLAVSGVLLFVTRVKGLRNPNAILAKTSIC